MKLMTDPPKEKSVEAIRQEWSHTSPAGHPGYEALLDKALELEKERNGLARWKREALTVDSWWHDVEKAVRIRPDVTLGDYTSAHALKLAKEGLLLTESERELLLGLVEAGIASYEDVPPDIAGSGFLAKKIEDRMTDFRSLQQKLQP